MLRRYALVSVLALFVGNVTAESDENPSKPLSKGKNTDLRTQFFDLRGGSERRDYFVDGAFMAPDKLKIKSELHYWVTLYL